MYVCHDCGEEFEVPMRMSPISGYPDEPDEDACPNCGSDDFNEVDPCDES